MKKNKMMRLASVLLVAVLLSTSVISGTFAKYTTQDSASDVARVAKWGVELQVVGNLYGDSYADTIVLDNADNITVQSVDKATDLVAPGTKNPNGFTFSLKGKPEVDGEVTTTMKIQNVFLKAGTYGVMIPVAANVITGENFDEFSGLFIKTSETAFQVATKFRADTTYYTLEDIAELTKDYYPLKYNLEGHTSYVHSTTETDSLKGAADKIADALGLVAATPAADTSITYTGTKEFDSNTDLVSWKVDNLRLTWSWKFEPNEDDGDDAHVYDKADTILGLLQNTSSQNVCVVKKTSETTYTNNVVEYEDYCLDTMFSIDITATQVD